MMTSSISLPSERDLAKQIGAHVSHTTSISFDALQVSARAAISASSLTSDALAVAVGSLYDSHTIAWQAAIAAVAGARAKESVPPPSIDAVDSAAIAKDEVAYDIQLSALRARLRNADVATAELASRQDDVGRAVAAAQRIQGSVCKQGSSEDSKELSTSASAAVSELRNVAMTLEAVQVLLDSESESSVPLLSSAASAVKRVPVSGTESIQPLPLPTSTFGRNNDESLVDNARLETLSARLVRLD